MAKTTCCILDMTMLMLKWVSFQHGKGGNSCDQRCSVLWQLGVAYTISKGNFIEPNSPNHQFLLQYVIFSGGYNAFFKKNRSTPKIGHFQVNTDKLLRHRWLATHEWCFGILGGLLRKMSFSAKARGKNPWRNRTMDFCPLIHQLFVGSSARLWILLEFVSMGKVSYR